ncbi:hypothetical protein EYF80_034061 [Liparis tanakae]|uniref:Uncharacterized protein n=1 Tax=Liparis tanakae TaxID=230148 RepID=A0A4Z2GQF9_9TELE|nr:hypothetical protein EYF80_034061 [Liparis tanakae]
MSRCAPGFLGKKGERTEKRHPGRSPPDVFLVERRSDWDWNEMQSMSGWRRRFGVGTVAVGVVTEMSLSAGWLSVDCGVGGLCPNGLGLRSRWALWRQTGETKAEHWARLASPLFRRDRLRAAALRGGLLPPVPLVGHEGFVDGEVLDVGLEDVHDIRLTGNHDQLGVERHGPRVSSMGARCPTGWTSKRLLGIGGVYLLPLVDVEAVVLQFLLQGIGDADVNVDDLLFTFPFDINVGLNPLKYTKYDPSGNGRRK